MKPFQSELRINEKELEHSKSLVPTLTDEEIPENPLQISIVWLVIKSEGAAVVEVRCKFRWICLTKSLQEKHP
jgi:hypothetical protein